LDIATKRCSGKPIHSALVNMFYSIYISSGIGLDRRDCSPRLVGDIIKKMFQSNSPLAMANRQRLASDEISAEKGGEV